jgi:outer membrane protein assembly factor BamB
MVLLILVVGILIAIPRLQAAYAAQPASSTGDWPQYMFNSGRSGLNKGETIINKTSAPHLKVHWTAKAEGMIFSQPVTSNGLIYWGSFDGYEHATDLNGNEVWKQSLGYQTTCVPLSRLGVVSSAAVASIPINGQATSVVFVGGGDDHLYALDAATGALLWRTPLGNPSSNTFLWDSPYVFNNQVYIGIATTGEGVGCKLIPGALFQLDASTGNILHTYNTVPTGCVGGGIWASPTFDASDGSIYLVGGTQGNCSTDKISIGMVKLRGSDLTYMSSWQIPTADRLTNDADFAGTPTLFTATINGTLRKLVGGVDKNGYYYAFDRTNLADGPLWRTKIAIPGACPQCGKGSISPSVWDGYSTLYVAGGQTTTTDGATCGGSVRALNPVDGSFIWEHCLPKTVMGAISSVPEVIAVVDTPYLTLIDKKTGNVLFKYSGHFYGSASISNGVLYVGTSLAHLLYAFGL